MYIKGNVSTFSAYTNLEAVHPKSLKNGQV